MGTGPVDAIDKDGETNDWDGEDKRAAAGGGGGAGGGGRAALEAEDNSLRLDHRTRNRMLRESEEQTTTSSSGTHMTTFTSSQGVAEVTGGVTSTYVTLPEAPGSTTSTQVAADNYGAMGADIVAAVNADQAALEQANADAARRRAARDARFNRMGKFCGWGTLGAIGVLSTIGLIYLMYSALTPDTHSPPTDQKVKKKTKLDVTKASLNPTKVQTVDLTANITVPSGNATLDKTTVKLVDHDTGKPNTKSDGASGTWTLDPATGVVTYTPFAPFQGGTRVLQFTINDSTGKTLPAANLSLEFDRRPVAFSLEIDNSADHTVPVTINPLTNVNRPAKKGTHDLDPAGVILVGVEKVDKDDTVKPTFPNSNLKLMHVPGEGDWTVDAVGNITFTPVKGLATDPHVATYQVADKNGLTSTPNTILVSAHIHRIKKAYDQALGQTDDKFWNTFDTVFVQASPPLALTEFRSHVSTLSIALTKNMSEADKAKALDKRIVGAAAIGKEYGDWKDPTKGNLSIDYLFKRSGVLFNDKVTGLSKVKYGSRLIRLNYMMRLLHQHQTEIDAMLIP